MRRGERDLGIQLPARFDGMSGHLCQQGRVVVDSAIVSVLLVVAVGRNVGRGGRQ